MSIRSSAGLITRAVARRTGVARTIVVIIAVQPGQAPPALIAARTGPPGDISVGCYRPLRYCYRYSDMAAPKPSDELAKARVNIGRKVRDLRTQRHWTQSELAARLALSQGRLSELERGEGSFSAEQLLVVLRLFNVSANHFALGAQDRGLELQNALARLGAHHLHVSDRVIPAEELDGVGNVVRQALLGASPRHLTALAPVLVLRCDQLNLRQLYADLVALGLERRLAWVVENTLEAIRSERRQPLPRGLAQRYRRAEAVLETFLEFVVAKALAADGAPPDLLDVTIASRATGRAMAEASSHVSKHWGIVTDLKPDDFVEALRGADAGV